MPKVAVVGCGYWGPNLIRNFHSLGNAEMVMVCDQDADRLAYLQSIYADIKVTQHLNDVLNDADIDAVAIATPVQTHFALASKCLQAGKHTLIEKPMARSVAECRGLIELADQKERVLMVGHTFAYTAAVRRIKEIYLSGEIGEIQYISSRRLNLGLFQNDINVAWDLAPHDISIILNVLGKKPTSVNCQGKAHLNPNVEDVTNMTLNFENGTFAIVQSSWLDPNKVREFTFVGSQKMLVYDDVEPTEKIKIYDKRVESPPHYDTFAEFHYSYHYGGMYAPHLQHVEPLKVECAHFIECIESGSRPDTAGEDGLEVVQILEAASTSLRNGGGEVRINP
jgi:predicted dehydrogenase